MAAERTEEEETGWGHREHTRGSRRRRTRTDTQRVRKKEREQDGPRWAHEQEIQGSGRGRRQGGRRGGKSGGKVGNGSEEQSVLLQEKISAIHVDPEALIRGGEGTRRVEGFSNALLPMDPQTPQPGRPGTGLGWGCRDGGGVSGGEVSQVKDRNRPRTSAEVLPPSSRGLQGAGQPKAECSGRAGPGAEPKQVQASWCGPEAVLPITCPSALQKKTCREKGGGRKKREIRVVSGKYYTYFTNIDDFLTMSQVTLVISTVPGALNRREGPSSS